MIKLKQFVKLFDGKLQGKLSAIELYRLLRFSHDNAMWIAVGVGVSCEVSDIVYGRVACIYSNGCFSLYCTRTESYMDFFPQDVVTVTVGLCA